VRKYLDRVQLLSKSKKNKYNPSC